MYSLNSELCRSIIIIHLYLRYRKIITFNSYYLRRSTITMYHIPLFVCLFFWYVIASCSSFSFTLSSHFPTDISVSGTCAGAPTFFQYTGAKDTNLVKFYWDFDDSLSGSNNLANGPYAVHTFTNAGTFTIRLIIQDQFLNQDTAYRAINIFAQPALNIRVEDNCEGNVSLKAENILIGGEITRGLNDYIEKLTWNIDNENIEMPSKRFLSQDLSHLKSGEHNIKLHAITHQGCSTEFTKKIEVFPLPKVDVNFSNTCIGDSTTFLDASLVETGNIKRVQWVIEGETFNGPSTKYMFEKAGNYQISQRVSSEAGCVQMKKHIIPITTSPKPPTNLVSDTVCFAEKAELRINTLFEEDNTKNIHWFYSPSSTKPFSYGTTYLTKPLMQDAAYWVGIKNNVGCMSAKVPIKAFVFSPENIELIASPLEVFLPDATVEFRITSQLPIRKWTWDIGEELFINKKTFTHTYQKAGDYAIKLELESTTGCQLTLNEIVNVKKLSGVSFPLAFSPNGDGTNDLLEIRYSDLASFDLRIYNESGQLVFESKNPAKTWDGRDLNNHFVRAGIYVCVVKAVGNDGEEITKRQRLTVIR